MQQVATRHINLFKSSPLFIGDSMTNIKLAATAHVLTCLDVVMVCTIVKGGGSLRKKTESLFDSHSFLEASCEVVAKIH